MIIRVYNLPNLQIILNKNSTQFILTPRHQKNAYVCKLNLEEKKMKDRLKNSISVLLPARNEAELSKTYLSALTDLLKQQTAIETWEVVISYGQPASTTPKTEEKRDYLRNVFPPQDRSYIQCLNAGVAACSLQYVLILNGQSLPANNYFEEVRYLLNEANSLFGLTTSLINHPDHEIIEGAKRANSAVNKKPQKVGPLTYYNETNLEKNSYTLFLNKSNMLINRKRLVLIGGFNPLLEPGGQEEVDLCLKAWRHCWKCLYTPFSYCSYWENREKNWDDTTAEEAKKTRHANNLMLRYLHERYWNFFCLIIECIQQFLISYCYPSKKKKEEREILKAFFQKHTAARQMRKWHYKRIHLTVNAMKRRFF